MITQFSTKMVIAVIFQLCIFNTAYLQLQFYLLPKYNQGCFYSRVPLSTLVVCITGMGALGQETVILRALV